MTRLDTKPPEQRPDFEPVVIAAGQRDHQAALRMVLTGSTLAEPGAMELVENLLAIVDQQGLDARLLIGARHRGRLVSAALAIESPGSTALLYVPPGDLSAEAVQGLRVVLTELQRRARAAGMAVLQALVHPADRIRPSIYAACGFRYLAELIYLERPVRARLTPAPAAPDSFDWISFSPDRRALFVEALEASYVGSLDCRGLSGLRRTEDVLEGHMATGHFDPDRWLVAMKGNRPAGVLLTSDVIHRSAMEVVYMGVSGEFRGQGVGNCLMGRALDLAGQAGVEHVTLAVDAINEPARHLYARWSMAEISRRRAWIISPAIASDTC